MNSQQSKAGSLGAARGQLEQYDNFDASMSPRDTNDDDDYDYSKGAALARSGAAEGHASSLGLNAKGESETTNTNYLGDDDGMIHENSQGQGTQKMR